jgi:hypothetical protein
MKTPVQIFPPLAWIVFIASCAPISDEPPVKLPRGGKVQWKGAIGYWDRNGDGKADRIRIYWGSGYAREYFDDDFNGKWDGSEHARGYNLASGLKENRIPEGLSQQDHHAIESALTHCIESDKQMN